MATPMAAASIDRNDDEFSSTLDCQQLRHKQHEDHVVGKLEFVPYHHWSISISEYQVSCVEHS